MKLLACGLLLWSWHVATVGSGFWQLPGFAVPCFCSSSLHPVPSRLAGQMGDLGIVCCLYILGEELRRSPVTATQHLLGPSLAVFSVTECATCTSQASLGHISEAHGPWFLHGLPSQRSGPAGLSGVPCQPSTPGCKHQCPPWVHSGLSQPISSSPLPSKAGITAHFQRLKQRLREVKSQCVISQPVRWSQDLDPDLTGSTVLLPPQPPSLSPASSLLTKIQPSFKALPESTKLSSGTWLRLSVHSSIPSFIHSQRLYACPPPSRHWRSYIEVQADSVITFHGFALTSFGTSDKSPL